VKRLVERLVLGDDEFEERDVEWGIWEGEEVESREVEEDEDEDEDNEDFSFLLV
jgi:hypothetical protein